MNMTYNNKLISSFCSILLDWNSSCDPASTKSLVSLLANCSKKSNQV